MDHYYCCQVAEKDQSREPYQQSFLSVYFFIVLNLTFDHYQIYFSKPCYLYQPLNVSIRLALAVTEHIEIKRLPVGFEIIAFWINACTFMNINHGYSCHTGLITTNIPNPGTRRRYLSLSAQRNAGCIKEHRCAEGVIVPCLEVTGRKSVKQSLAIWGGK